MKINSIRIENVRGIHDITIEAVLHPNKPTIFVAPNGFGKSSIATAFKSLKSNRIELDEDSFFNGNCQLDPVITIYDGDGNNYLANATTNNISKVFSTFVINSQVKSKAISRNMGGFTSATSSMIVEPIVLFNFIPNKADFIYSITEMKQSFQNSFSKLINNISYLLKNCNFVLDVQQVKGHLLKLIKVKNTNKIDSFIALFDAYSFNKTKANIISEHINFDIFKNIEEFQVVVHLVKKYCPDLSELECFVDAIQLVKVIDKNRDKLNSIFKYYNFLKEKDSFHKMISFFECTWKEIQPAKKDGKWQLEFPKANQISNGERDVLCFLGKLFEAKIKMKKNKCILIIDEIFDYLDDANIIAAQYFITKMIEDYNNNHKELFVILLTHIDPTFFKTYSFSTKNVHYLYSATTLSNKFGINNLIKNRRDCERNNPDTYKIISSNYLHYSESDIDAQDYLVTINVSTQILLSKNFRTKAIEEVANYIYGINYDPLLTCCGLRLLIEKAIYKKLDQAQKEIFVETFPTKKKLEYAKNQNVDIPEVYFLLGIIYNEANHIDAQGQILNRIASKLKNKVILHMIKQVYENNM